MITVIEDLQRTFSDLADPGIDPELHARASVLQVGGYLHMDFFGDPSDEPFNQLCTTLVRPEIATILGSLSLRSPDEGANGTCNWDLSPLVDAETSFPNLLSFTVARKEPGQHNQVIIGADYEEEGVLGRLLHKAPSLNTLIAPSAPDATFFSMTHPSLRHLGVDSGYDTQNFIGNFAEKSCFPNLSMLEFGEFNETYLEDFPTGCTPFEDYRRLFTAPHFGTVGYFVWRNPVCSEEQITELRSLRPRSGLMIKIIRFSDWFV
jgi:hypothetical protein